MKKGDIICWQVRLDNLFFAHVPPYYDYCKDPRYYMRKMTGSLTRIAYWRIKSLKPFHSEQISRDTWKHT